MRFKITFYLRKYSHMRNAREEKDIGNVKFQLINSVDRVESWYFLDVLDYISFMNFLTTKYLSI